MVELRNFSIDDAETLQHMYYRNMPLDAICHMICEWNLSEYQGKYFEMFAIVSDHKIVGQLSLYEHSVSTVSIGLEIFSEFQRQGFGKQAIASVLQICKSKGYKIVCNQTRTDNKPSIALQRSLGFESDLYRYRNQKGQDIYLFLKVLD